MTSSQICQIEQRNTERIKYEIKVKLTQKIDIFSIQKFKTEFVDIFCCMLLNFLNSTQCEI